MAKLDDELELASGGGFVLGREADEAMLSLLASMACSDGAVHPDELAFLGTLRRDLSPADLEAWVRTHARPRHLQQLPEAIRSPDDRWKTLRFAARMAWKDGEIAGSEQDFLRQLAGVLELPASAVDRVLSEMKPDDGHMFAPERILRALLDVHWDSVQLASGGLVSEDLVGVSPPTAEVVARVGLEKVEVMALCTTGIVARFREGPSFLPWPELVTYTRERGLGAALRLHTEDGRSYTLVDARLAGLALVLDRLMDREEARQGDPSAANPPKIDTLRGEQ
ncbi:MAG: TerB family tellurite resistance protein [Myxococcota bacterium]